jgi:hypothetical protein
MAADEEVRQKAGNGHTKRGARNGEQMHLVPLIVVIVRPAPLQVARPRWSSPVPDIFLKWKYFLSKGCERSEQKILITLA